MTGCQLNDLSNHFKAVIPLFINSVYGAGSKSDVADHYAVHQHVIIVDADQYIFRDQTGITFPGRKNNHLACGVLLLHDSQFCLGDQVYNEEMEGIA